jgi:flagellar basal-body rod modification protein FlgD
LKGQQYGCFRNTTSIGRRLGSPKSQSVDYESFLKLLVAQLKNQDPTNPTDGTQFLSQLASFSTVEQAIQTNSKLDTLITGSLLERASSAVGRVASSPDGSVTGVVQSVSVSENGLIAHLRNGFSIRLGEGVSIS